MPLIPCPTSTVAKTSSSTDMTVALLSASGTASLHSGGQTQSDSKLALTVGVVTQSA
jgi:hypothetical protein